MKARTSIAICAAVALSAGLVAADTTIHASVLALGTYKADPSKRLLTLDRAEGVLPGASGSLRDNNGTSYGVEIIGLGQRAAFGTTSASEAIVKQNLLVDVIGTKKCSHAGDKPDLTGTDVITGKVPPPGYQFVELGSIGANESPLPDGICNHDADLRFELRKGYEEILPGSHAYTIPASGSGIPILTVSITWALKDLAGGCAVGFGNTEKTRSLLRGQRLVVEKAHCHHLK